MDDAAKLRCTDGFGLDKHGPDLKNIAKSAPIQWAEKCFIENGTYRLEKLLAAKPLRTPVWRPKRLEEIQPKCVLRSNPLLYGRNRSFCRFMTQI